MTADAAPLPPVPVLGVLFRPVATGPFTVRRRMLAFAGAAAVLGGIAVLDRISSPHVRLGPLYFLPVALAAWFGGRWPGYMVAAAAAVVWVVLPRSPALRPDAGSGALFGSLLLRLVVYPTVVEALVLLQDVERRLQRAVDQRTAELRREIVERLRAEAGLRAVAAQLSAAEDAERRRIAYDIHDALSQSLGVVKLNLETVVARTATDAPDYGRLGEAVATVDSLIGQTRDLTFDLYPSMLDHFGLVPTLREFAGQFGRRATADVTVSELGDRSRRPVPPPLVAYLFRATKEVVSNAVRHGRAREVVVTVHWSCGEADGGDGCDVRVVVDDDGQGFDPATALAPRAGRGLGLTGIAERLANLGGRLRLESEPGRGARVILEVPFDPVPPASLAAGSAPVS